MISLPERTRSIASSRLYELLAARGATSVVDPFMGVPTHLNYLKRHDIAVHGGDVLDWFVRAGEGIVVNDNVYLRDDEVAQLVEMQPGRIYTLDQFKAWEGVFFSEEQCTYLSIWLDNVRDLRSDGQTGLAILGLWNVFCYWIHKAREPDDMPDVAPSELAWSYVRQTERYVATNRKFNSVARGDVLETLAKHDADAVFLAPPARNTLHRADPRIWMWEAWWQGDPYFTIDRAYGNTLFGKRSDDRTYERALATVVDAAAKYPLLIMQVARDRTDDVARILRSAGRTVALHQPSEFETYLIA